MSDGTRARVTGLLLGYLSGKQDPQERPALFEEDVLLMAVAWICDEDPGWLPAQLAREGWLPDRRAVLRDLCEMVRPS